MAINNKADFFLNFQQFGDLKLRARENSDDAASAVARQFEGLFVQQMLSAMRSASSIDSTQHSSYMDFYQEMYDKQLAQTIAGQDRLGVAKMIMQQIPGNGDGLTGAGSAASSAETMAVTAASRTVAAPAAAPVSGVEVSAGAAAEVSNDESVTVEAGVVLGKVVDDDFAELAQIEQVNNRWQQPVNFIADIWPEVSTAARSLGVSPQLLVAQSALETGWGRHTMKFDDGRSSYNLFGIKAGPDWQGAALKRQSLEYRDGALYNQVSRFRAYSAPADSLSDYVDFIKSNPRYQPALASAANDQAYIRAIHDAGYATDPHYADKVIGILNGELLQQSLAAIDSGASSNG
ncbi:MAG: flagellar assembly peptidoglycan hydrolase FlgJ [Gammaproteobacteria bacterium]|nr:flagellar assembly peptidoglycan hydrolase FlgJ [Gammaproteobacteria bacterium]